MQYLSDQSQYGPEAFRTEARRILEPIADLETLDQVRRALLDIITAEQFDATGTPSELSGSVMAMVRDCARALRSMIRATSDEAAGFSITQALWDLARGKSRPDLQPGFFADMIALVRGLDGRPVHEPEPDLPLHEELEGREAALVRSDDLDQLWSRMEQRMSEYFSGLTDEAVQRRAARRDHIIQALGATEQQWHDWRWQVANIVTDPETLARVATVSDAELDPVARARDRRIPFGVTPYYASLFDDDPDAGRDRAVRAQVLPPADYVEEMSAHRGEHRRDLDFMQEHNTSPVDLVTRRYPAVAILKPFNTCPQICVYCQRNWEIDQAMAPGALASRDSIENACRWIEQHPAIREVLVTGGDPLALADNQLGWILDRVAAIPSVDLIRIGSRIPVTVPMRITDALAEKLGSLRKPGRREVCLVTHVESSYEITPDLVEAVNRLRMQGIGVYNQLVYTFFVSRRFEAAHLRMLLRLAGIDPYYTFAPKGKQETHAYLLPLARILQEQREEARLLPGIRRTDEPVYNVPALGKEYLRAAQRRDLLSILPDGCRVYEFHPWDRDFVEQDSYVGWDVPILDYLCRLAQIGEDPDDYNSIWYYF